MESYRSSTTPSDASARAIIAECAPHPLTTGEKKNEFKFYMRVEDMLMHGVEFQLTCNPNRPLVSVRLPDSPKETPIKDEPDDMD